MPGFPQIQMPGFPQIPEIPPIQFPSGASAQAFAAVRVWLQAGIGGQGSSQLCANWVAGQALHGSGGADKHLRVLSVWRPLRSSLPAQLLMPNHQWDLSGRSLGSPCVGICQQRLSGPPCAICPTQG